MSHYVKLIDGELEYPPVNKGSIANYNLDSDLLIKDGYKELIETEIPQNGRLYEITYTEDDKYIYSNISYLESEDEFNKRIKNTDIENEIKALEEQISNIDLKRIRAICEPEIKDKATGETWLDFYNAQVMTFRSEIRKLQERIDKNDITE